MRTNLRKIFVLVIIIMSIFTAKAGDPDDQTIIVFKAPERVEITAKAGSGNTISYVRMFNLQNPGQFNEILIEENCNNSKSECLYYVSNSKLKKGDIYRIEMYYSGSEQPFVYQFIF